MAHILHQRQHTLGTMTSNNKMTYGMCTFQYLVVCRRVHLVHQFRSARLGNSGLKVSRIILGCMSYGDPKWQEWVLEEEEASKHIKFACVPLSLRISDST